MMQKKIPGRENYIDAEIQKERWSAEEIHEILLTIESYLDQTRETILRIEKFIMDVKEERVQNTRMENDSKKERMEEADKEPTSFSIRL